MKFSVYRIAVCLAFLASPALADELAGGGEPLKIVKIAPETCAQIAPYLSSDEAAYKPGIAADGSAVAPADIDGGTGFEPRSLYTFPVQIYPLAGGPASPYRDATKMTIADVTLDTKTGRVTIDGQDVSGGNRALIEACSHQAATPQP
ncbi:MAG: hypothetical protein Q7T44_08885 [Parvibaculum sp.]|nr:hypothetical protein [Parvibaculum sp.]